MGFSFGDFKLLENNLGLSGYSKPNWFDTFSMGDAFKNFTGGFGDAISAANKHLKDNNDLYGFAGNALKIGGDLYANNRMASISEKMNNRYMAQYDREQKRQEDAEKEYQLGFTNSNLNKWTS